MPKPRTPITSERIFDAVQRQASSLDNPGICKACGADADGCDPDTRNATCEICGEDAVFGAFELMFEIEDFI